MKNDNRSKLAYELSILYPDVTDIYSHSAAVFEGSDDINVDFNISDPSWTVVKIHDNKTGNFIEAMNADDFYAENEDFYDEEEDY